MPDIVRGWEEGRYTAQVGRATVVLSAAIGVLAAAVMVLIIVVVRDHQIIHGRGSPDASVLIERVLDTEALNSDIANQYKDRFTQQVTVNCPKDQPAKPGVTFTCSLEGASGRIEVTVQNDNGDYTWRVVG
jgi:hypothetical protein